MEPERAPLHGGLAGADGLDRAHHATLPLEQAVGDRDDCYVRLRGARGAPDVPGDLLLVARRIERAGRHIGAGGRATDAGIAMPPHRRRTVPLADEVD